MLCNSGRDSGSIKTLEGDKIFQKDNLIGKGYYIAHSNNIDATIFPFGFSSPVYDDSKWNNAYLCDNIDEGYLLFPYHIENVKRHIVDKTNMVIKKIK